MNINIDKEKMQQVGKTALKVGRQIIIQGTVSVAAKGVANGLEVGLNQGFDKVKKMDVDDFLGIKNKKKRKTFKEIVEGNEDEESKLQAAYDAGLTDGLDTEHGDGYEITK